MYEWQKASSEGLAEVINQQQLQTRQRIVDYLLINHNPLFRTQTMMIQTLGISQATLVRYISVLEGEGAVVEKPFGTAVIYEILHDVVIAKGLVEKYMIFNLEHLNKIKGHNVNGWRGKVYNFNEMIYITARHESGFSMTVPIYNKDLKELVKAAALGLNLGVLVNAIAEWLERNR
jgi:hypothetical protein